MSVGRNGERGTGLLEVLVAIVVLGACLAGVAGQLLAVRSGARRAAVEGRRAELAQRLADRVRSGMATGPAGALSVAVGGEAYGATFTRRDDVAPGAVEFSAAPASGYDGFALGPAQPVP